MTQAEVSVTDVGEHGREVKIEARDLRHEGDAHPEVPEIVLTKDGKPIEGGTGIRVMKKKDASGAVTLSVTVMDEGKTTTVDIQNAGSMTDAVLAAEIQSRLLAAGFDAVVRVEGEQITVEKRRP